MGLAVDSSGNVFIADSDSDTIKEFSASGKALQTLIGPATGVSTSATVDGAGNLYLAGDAGLTEWTAATQTFHTLVPMGTINTGQIGSGHCGRCLPC